MADHLETGCDLTVGAYATLDDLPLKKPYLVDADGNRISTTRDDVNWLCQIIGRRFRPAERTYDLTLLVVGAALVRLRAPSGVITGYTDNGDGTSTFQLDRTALDQSADDGTFFTAGDDLIVTNPDGTTWESTELEVTASSGSFVDVEGTLSSVPSSWEWHVLELAPLDTDGSGAGYSNPGLNGAYSNIERVYAFLANSPTSSNVDPTLGDAGLEADIYGA